MRMPWTIENTVILPPMTSVISAMTAMVSPASALASAGVAQIVEQVFDCGVRAALANALGDSLDSAQLETRAATGFLWGHPLRDQVRVCWSRWKRSSFSTLDRDGADEATFAAAGAYRYSASRNTSPIA